MMRIRFQADADLNQIIVKATLRLEPSIDFQTAQTAGLAGLDDPDVLKLAAEQAGSWYPMTARPCQHISASLLHWRTAPAF